MWMTIVSIVHMVLAVFLIVVVLLQTGKDAGMSGAISGGSSDTFFGKNSKRTVDALLSKVTVVVAILFVVTSLLMALFL